VWQLKLSQFIIIFVEMKAKKRLRFSIRGNKNTFFYLRDNYIFDTCGERPSPKGGGLELAPSKISLINLKISA